MNILKAIFMFVVLGLVLFYIVRDIIRIKLELCYIAFLVAKVVIVIIVIALMFAIL